MEDKTINLKSPEQIKAELDKFRAEAQALVVSGQSNSIVQIRQGYLTAIAPQVKRDLEVVRANCLTAAERYPEGMYYEWTVWRKIDDRQGGIKKVPQLIKGPSIRAAEIIAQNYVNSAVDVFPVAITPEHIVFAATFIDQERGTNFGFSYIMNRKALKLSAKQMEGGEEEAFRQEEIRVQAVQARIWRSVIFRGTDRGLREEMVKIAESKVAQSLQGEDLDRKRKSLVSEFYRLYEIGTVDLEKYLDRRQKEWTGKDCARLIGLMQGVKENPELKAQIFDAQITEATFEDDEDKKKRALSPDEKRALNDIARMVKLLEADPEKYGEWIGRATNGAAKGRVDLEENPALILPCVMALDKIARKQGVK